VVAVCDRALTAFIDGEVGVLLIEKKKIMGTRVYFGR
jgi:hypothetical protein